MVEPEDFIHAADLISDFVYERWSEVVPINAILIFEGLDVNNQRALYALSNTDITPWTLGGMLSLIQTDNLSAWEEQNWVSPVADTELPEDDD